MPVVRFQGAVVVQLVFWSVGFGAGQGGLFLRLRRCRLIECIVVCVCVCVVYLYIFLFAEGSAMRVQMHFAPYHSHLRAQKVYNLAQDSC